MILNHLFIISIALNYLVSCLTYSVFLRISERIMSGKYMSKSKNFRTIEQNVSFKSYTKERSWMKVYLDLGGFKGSYYG